MIEENKIYSLLFGFILGYSVNYYNKQYLKKIFEKIEIIETKNNLLKQDIENLKIKIFENKVSIKELNQKQESLINFKKKKRNKIEVQYDDVDFGIHTPPSQ